MKVQEKDGFAKIPSAETGSVFIYGSTIKDRSLGPAGDVKGIYLKVQNDLNSDGTVSANYTIEADPSQFSLPSGAGIVFALVFDGRAQLLATDKNQPIHIDAATGPYASGLSVTAINIENLKSVAGQGTKKYPGSVPEEQAVLVQYEPTPTITRPGEDRAQIIKISGRVANPAREINRQESQIALPIVFTSPPNAGYSPATGFPPLRSVHASISYKTVNNSNYGGLTTFPESLPSDAVDDEWVPMQGDSDKGYGYVIRGEDAVRAQRDTLVNSVGAMIASLLAGLAFGALVKSPWD